MKKSQRARVANYLDRRPFWFLHFENEADVPVTGELYRRRNPDGTFAIGIDLRDRIYGCQRIDCRKSKATRRTSKDLLKWLKPLIGWVCVGVDRKPPMQVWKRRKPRSYK